MSASHAVGLAVGAESVTPWRREGGLATAAQEAAVAGAVADSAAAVVATVVFGRGRGDGDTVQRIVCKEPQPNELERNRVKLFGYFDGEP